LWLCSYYFQENRLRGIVEAMVTAKVTAKEDIWVKDMEAKEDIWAKGTAKVTANVADVTTEKPHTTTEEEAVEDTIPIIGLLTPMTPTIIPT
jgi:hypothetical protein